MLPFPLDHPLATANLPGIGGVIKAEPEDFEVEEIAAYEPSGEGDHLFLWIEKRDLGAEFFQRQVAQRLGVRPGDVGTAGMKDRRAVTRQWVSVPATAEANLAQLEGNGIRVLNVSRHGNKLRPGHLHGNRFRILIRDVMPNGSDTLNAITTQLERDGLPNFYGSQRFGIGGETAINGMMLLRGERMASPVRNPFLRKLFLSAAQSLLFNATLSRRMTDGLFRQVISGDVMAKVPAGGMFVAEDVAAEQIRFDNREIVPAAPMFGKKTFPSRDEAARREASILTEAGLTRDTFRNFGKLMMGTRRHNIVYLEEFSTEMVPEGVRVNVRLPAGSYATVLLRELMKNAAADIDDRAMTIADDESTPDDISIDGEADDSAIAE